MHFGTIGRHSFVLSATVTRARTAPHQATVPRDSLLLLIILDKGDADGLPRDTRRHQTCQANGHERRRCLLTGRHDRRAGQTVGVCNQQ